eukprot:TRINITY_DN15539_c0_g1_i2.p1 TRINITY_DN15539_c0_g1~~TRINITY_DN15539_c0_g1_i2.p1  ORF type:complete len:771 (-),score=172.02 TRINITY_DN15539_c0_g1_i2:292-2604(-)
MEGETQDLQAKLRVADALASRREAAANLAVQKLTSAEFRLEEAHNDTAALREELHHQRHDAEHLGQEESRQAGVCESLREQLQQQEAATYQLDQELEAQLQIIETVSSRLEAAVGLAPHKLKHAESRQDLKAPQESKLQHRDVLLSRLESAAGCVLDRFKNTEATSGKFEQELDDVNAKLMQQQMIVANAEEESESLKLRLIHLEAASPTSEEANEASRVNWKYGNGSLPDKEGADGPHLIKFKRPNPSEKEAEREHEQIELKHVEPSHEESEHRYLQVSLNHVEPISRTEAANEVLHIKLRHVEEASAAAEASVQDLRAKLRRFEASERAETETEHSQIELRHVEASGPKSEATDAESGAIIEDLRMKLMHAEGAAGAREMVVQDLQLKLGHMEASSAVSEAVEEATVEELKNQLKHSEARSEVSPALVEDKRWSSEPTCGVPSAKPGQVNISTGSESRELRDVSVQTDHCIDMVDEEGYERGSGVRADANSLCTANGATLAVPLNRTPATDTQAKDTLHEGTAHSTVDARRNSRRRISTVTFADEPRGHAAVELSDDGDHADRAALHARTAHRRLSNLSQGSAQEHIPPQWTGKQFFKEEDMWDAAHVARITRQLFDSHDTDKSGTIDWDEARPFLDEFFWMHNQPPPPIPKPAFKALYAQIKDDSPRQTEDGGLDVEEMIAFLIKVHAFVFKQLGKEMRQRSRAFSAAFEEGEDATAAKRSSRRSKTCGPSRLSSGGDEQTKRYVPRRKSVAVPSTSGFLSDPEDPE